MAENKKPKNAYRALRIVSLGYIWAGFITLFLGIVGGGYTLVSSPRGISVNGSFYSQGSNLGTGLAIIFGSVVTSLSFFAVGQIIQVVLEMVENSRHQSEMLERIARSLAKR